jgi:anti-sigma regulatory factor (Ser/Thr protein kinase)
VREALGEELSEQTLGDVELLVSELATNSVRHAGCDDRHELAMETAVSGDRVRVRVCDHGKGFRAARPASTNAKEAGGFGLVLLERVADDWGVHRGERFCVWFELERS